MPTVHTVLTNAAHQDWEIKNIDVKSTYPNAPLKEVIYMKLPIGVLKPGQEGKVLRLLKGLYGLKQARRGWYCIWRWPVSSQIKWSSSDLKLIIQFSIDAQRMNIPSLPW